MRTLLKLLHRIERELGGTDARAEIGGRPPEDPRLLAHPVHDDLRVVVVFDAALDAATRSRLAARLETLLAPFGDLAEGLELPEARLFAVAQGELDDALRDLADRSKALAALVIDDRSEVLWGSSEVRGAGWDVDRMEDWARLAEAIEAEGLDPAAVAFEASEAGGVDETVRQRWARRFARLRPLLPEGDEEAWRRALAAARAVHRVREACAGGRAPERLSLPDAGVFARAFATIYAAVLVYEGPFSELHAEGPLLRALPHIERLVLALPPVEPPPRKAKVLRFPPR